METAIVVDEGGRDLDVDDDAALFRQIYPGLRRFAAVTAAAEDDPDDLVQEAVARTLRRQTLASLDHPEAYLRRAIVNLAANRRRSLARWRNVVPQLRRDERQEAEYGSDLGDLLRLSAHDRALLFLVEVEGRPYAEAAGLLGLSEEAARTRAARARKVLRLEIEGEL
jgi:RNA polymerase sigma-70 factor (ECF subfamily)